MVNGDGMFYGGIGKFGRILFGGDIVFIHRVYHIIPHLLLLMHGIHTMK